MDIAAAFKVIERLSQPPAASPNADHAKSDPVQHVRTAIAWTIGIAIGASAAYLSWQCNSRMQYGIVWKAVNAVFAYMFGLVYLLLYVVFRWDVCRRIPK